MHEEFSPKVPAAVRQELSQIAHAQEVRKKSAKAMYRKGAGTLQHSGVSYPTFYVITFTKGSVRQGVLRVVFRGEAEPLLFWKQKRQTNTT